MYCATIDCGTTNSRVYIVDGAGTVRARAGRKIGVRDTAISGNNSALRQGLREAFDTAVGEAGLTPAEITCILSSGMITSELGLVEIPHLWAPCSIETLARNLASAADLDLFPAKVPLYFVRGVKNAYSPGSATMQDVGNLDFMRGEETQVAGLLATGALKLPGVVVVLSSHTKFIPIDTDGRILGSITTLSGQLYEAVLKETFVGKSVRSEDGFDDADYFNAEVVDLAHRCIESWGLLRGLMFPRFLDTLLHVPWYDRKLFAESLLAAEDMRAFAQVRDFMKVDGVHLVLVGMRRRCSIYRHLLRELMGSAEVTCVTEESDIDQLSIRGILNIAERAGVLHGST
jgi:2-dehydro-3-deoxygalactonokinase